MVELVEKDFPFILNFYLKCLISEISIEKFLLDKNSKVFELEKDEGNEIPFNLI